ncbi:YcaO-like family protein [Bradyrhizobium brasilense]|uniref:YcaO-like family protein n=1 Tax=Bradyrhizobium brasilense TaxID=1419277 RepID=UPI0015A12EAD|nr:YcaO-like family protein [Bradyrhizobium brasilense]
MRILDPASASNLVAEGILRLREENTPAGIAISWDGKNWKRHVALPLPSCACAGRRLAPTGLEMKSAIDPLFGIISAINTWTAAGLEPDQDAVLAIAKPCRLETLGGLPSIIDGAGFGLHPNALNAATGEVLERYCASFMPAGLPVCSARELGAEHLIPTNASFAGEPIGAEQPLRWTEGRRLIDGSLCWVQASEVYFPYVCHDDEPRRSWGGSGGLAAGDSWQAAVVHATHERLERDSFIRAWRFDGPRRALNNPYIDRNDLRFIQIGSRFGIPVVTAFVEADSPPYCTAGIAARATITEAMQVSACEALGAQALYRLCKDDAEPSLETRRSHALDLSLRSVREKWRASGPDIRGPAPPLDWDDLLLRIPDGVAVEVTTPDVRAIGVRVVRVVVPGCHGWEPIRGQSRLGGNPQPPPF